MEAFTELLKAARITFTRALIEPGVHRAVVGMDSLRRP